MGCRRLSGLLETAVLDVLMSTSQKPLSKALYLCLKSGAVVLALSLSRQIHSPDLFLSLVTKNVGLGCS